MSFGLLSAFCFARSIFFAVPKVEGQVSADVLQFLRERHTQIIPGETGSKTGHKWTPNGPPFWSISCVCFP